MEKLRALAGAATFYRVARTLPKRYDVGKGLRRYEPVRKIIGEQNAADFSGDALLPSIKKVRERISAEYGGREVLSLTTKFLWLRVRSPVIIYDSQVRRAVGTRLGDIDEYYSRWREKFKQYAQEIDAACDSLSSIRDYSIDPEVVSAEYIAETASQQWFKGRVLDVYLWHRGPDA
ncbi:MAG: hypothetical protein HY652_13475 [Acidobacteria bacterium]|nr:hypothetical protein [Acidobacteriota bacterium]